MPLAKSLAFGILALHQAFAYGTLVNAPVGAEPLKK